MISTTTSLSHRDRAVLLAVAAGRCEISGDLNASLVIDGLSCCDQFLGARMTRAGLLAPARSRLERARLTPSGRALLNAA